MTGAFYLKPEPFVVSSNCTLFLSPARDLLNVSTGNSVLNNSAGLSSIASALVCVACCSGLQPVQSRYRERDGLRQRMESL